MWVVDADGGSVGGGCVGIGVGFWDEVGMKRGGGGGRVGVWSGTAVTVAEDAGVTGACAAWVAQEASARQKTIKLVREIMRLFFIRST